MVLWRPLRESERKILSSNLSSCNALHDQSPCSVVLMPNLIFYVYVTRYLLVISIATTALTCICICPSCLHFHILCGFYILERKPVIDNYSIHNFSGKRLILSRRYLPKLLQNTGSFHISQVALILDVLDSTQQ